MKTIKAIGFIILSCSFLLLGCTEDLNDLDKGQEEMTLKNSHAKEIKVTVPFKADFTVWDYSDYADISCGGYPDLLLTMKGDGKINHLGKINTQMTFCCNVETGIYVNTVGWFAAANGDTLFFEIPYGEIVPNLGDNSDYYQTKFVDQMDFIGGTGRFEGAKGTATTNAYVHNNPDEWHTDFFSTGELILIKGKR